MRMGASGFSYPGNGKIDGKFSHGGNIYEIERRCGKKIIDFSANINPLGLGEGIKKALYRDFDRILHYPETEPVELLQKIAAHFRISPKNILLGNGSAELIYLVANTFRPKTALIPVPTFSEYERAARSGGAKIRFIKLDADNGFRLNLCGIDKAEILFLCHPNNPNGDFLLSGPAKAVRLAGRMLFIDEAFMDFLPDEENHTLIHEAVRSRRIVVLRTFTKIFCLPGLRMGYIVAHEDTIKKLKRHRAPWNTNSLAQLAAGLALGDKEYIKSSRRVIKEEREFLVGQLSKIKALKIYPSVTNFLLIKIGKAGLYSGILTAELLKKGILVRDCSNFRNLGNSFIRVAVRKREENRCLIGALRELFYEKS